MAIDVLGDFRDDSLIQDIVLKRIVFDVAQEYFRATALYKPFNSAHEGYATLLEEMDELWEEVKKRPDAVSKDEMRSEAIQVAAMAIRFIFDVIKE